MADRRLHPLVDSRDDTSMASPAELDAQLRAERALDGRLDSHQDRILVLESWAREHASEHRHSGMVVRGPWGIVVAGRARYVAAVAIVLFLTLWPFLVR